MNTFYTVFTVLHWVCIALCLTYSWTSPFIKIFPDSKPARLARELRPFAWVFALFVAFNGGVIWTVRDAVEKGWSGAGIALGAILFALWGWLAHKYYKEWKNSDDDRWKKRRKKLKAKVKEVAGKLVVEPEPELVRVTA